MSKLATIPNHSPNCSGCPACNPFAAQLLGLNRKAYADFLSGSTLANLSANRKPTLRTVSAATACKCGGKGKGESSPSAATEPLPYTRALEAKRSTSPPKATHYAASVDPQPYTRALERMRATGSRA